MESALGEGCVRGWSKTGGLQIKCGLDMARGLGFFASGQGEWDMTEEEFWAAVEGVDSGARGETGAEVGWVGERRGSRTG